MIENINQLKQAISKLDEREAKALLSLIFIRSEQGKEDEVKQLLQSMKISLVEDLRKEQKTNHPHTVHILFGGAPAGSLRAAFRNKMYAKTEEIIVLPGVLSVGPIEALHTNQGIEHRFQWFKENYLDEFKQLDEMQQGLLQAIEKIKAISPYQQVIIWTGKNAAEQTGLRLVLYLMQNKVNEIFELNTYKAFHEFHIYPALEEERYPRTSGELTPKELLRFYEQLELRPMKAAKRQALSDEGRNILFTEHHLRTWNHGELWSSNSDRDDHFIIESAKKLHQEQGKHEYMKAARLIGEVICYMEQYTGDEWIEYRLRHLIAQDKFDYQGDLRAMRLYEVRLKD